MFDTSKHSMRSGRLSRFSTSRSSSSAATRRRLVSSRWAESAASARRAFSTASSTSRRFSTALRSSTSTRDPRLDVEELADHAGIGDVGGYEHLGRSARQGAVVLDDEGLEHGLRVLACDVLEVEGIAVDHLSVAKREHLDGGALGLDREPITSTVPTARLSEPGAPRGRIENKRLRYRAASSKRSSAAGLPHPLLELALNGVGVAREGR